MNEKKPYRENRYGLFGSMAVAGFLLIVYGNRVRRRIVLSGFDSGLCHTLVDLTVDNTAYVHRYRK
jgi:hypothetical protein